MYNKCNSLTSRNKITLDKLTAPIFVFLPLSTSAIS